MRSPPPEKSDDRISEKELAVILEIAEYRERLLEELAAALRANDMERLKEAAAELAGEHNL